ncbi:hypothetical protein [Tropicimonas sp.]|uniref:hypothetical protein n=1 Tax=Tropicimonas sp. TaxID=2067044 RepID=UPI003A88F5A4
MFPFLTGALSLVVLAGISLLALRRAFLAEGPVWLLYAAVAVVALQVALASLLLVSDPQQALPVSAAGVLLLWLASRMIGQRGAAGHSD